MSVDGEPRGEMRPVRAAEPSAAASLAPRPQLRDEGAQRARWLTRGIAAVVVLLLLALAAYEALLAPEDGQLAWRPPAGLAADETPQWLQTLCATHTPELCSAADRARTASDCEAMRAALRALEAVDRKLAARGGVSAQQHWVLVELYGQGHELCQFESSGQKAGDAR